MALKEKSQHKGTRTFRRRTKGERRRRTSLVALGGIVIVLVLGGVVGSAYLGATSIETTLRAALPGGKEEVSVARVEDPTFVNQPPEIVPEEPAAEESSSEESAAEEELAAEALASQQAGEAARLEAEQVAAAEEEAAAALEAEQDAAAEEEAAAALEAEIAAQAEQEEVAAAQAGQEEVAAAQAEQEDELAAQQPTLEEELPTEQGLPEDEPAPVAPSDSTMYLDVPKLGISGAIVAGGEAGLELGTQLVSGAPWVEGSNTYIAGHRIGFPGTGSDRIFYDLPSMTTGDVVSLTDSNGEAYTYQVSEVFAVTPFDVWVTAPTGSDMVTLQVCTETPEDWTTIGPGLMSSGPESGRLIVRAVRV